MTTEQAHPFDKLSPDTIVDAIESQGYLTNLSIYPLNSYENRVYQIGLDDGGYLIAKFYRPARWSQAQILEEHTFTNALSAADISVVAPLANTQGETLFEHDGFFFALFNRMGGYAPETDNEDVIFNLGRLLGRMHLAASTVKFEHRLTLNAERLGHQSVSYLLENDFIPLELIKSYEAISQQLMDLVDAQIKDIPNISYQAIHGDFHIGNILLRGEDAFLVDFDDCIQGPKIQDIWMLLSGDRQHKTLQLNNFIDGYYEFNDLNLAELRLIEPLRTLRIIHYTRWLASRWNDPAFPKAFPWFNTIRYWSEHILELKEQLSALNEPPIDLMR